ncbi:Mechanosensitive ion channel [Prevotellaceae bacterium HUN156]|nr:Mechanosensitive ion channel [Prevotellaceae bacterium HUN156]
MKRTLTLLLVLLITMGAQAVLKEKDLEQTLHILRTELTTHHRELSQQIEMNRKQSELVRQQLMETMQRSDQNSLMLYSQKLDYVFDLTYACHEATEQFHDFRRQQLPFKIFLEKADAEIARYDSLITSLKSMPVTILSDKAQIDRNVCMTLATNIRNSLVENRTTLQDFIRYYDTTEKRLSHLNDYAQKRYQDIQTSIFKNGGDSYISILKNWNRNWNTMTRTVKKKYQPNAHSQWDSRWIFGLLLSTIFYAIIATLLNFLLIRFLVPQRFRTAEFKKKRACITMATTTITFALILGISLALVESNFFIMAANLLVQYAWLLGIILFSLLLRVKGEQIKSAFHIYTPLLFVGFLVIAIRIILIPNELVNIAFPPILLLCALWQWSVIRRHNNNIPRSDIFYTYISLIVFLCSVCCSWIGYTLLAVQILIWWIMQLTCILTITCISGYLKMYGEKHGFAERPITKTWAYDLAYQVLLPVLGVASVMISIYWAADVFNLSDLCWKIFKTYYVNLKNFKISILTLAMVITLWFCFAYVNRTILQLMRMHFMIKDPETAASREVMGKNVLQVIVWGSWFLITMAILKISMEWLLVVTGGLSTGIGFASKDIIENIYYGISLMTGRIKVGDLIQVDDTTGRVTSISYTSTIIEALTGEVITFQNSQLFSKNYKNLTRNHGYVLQIITFGVAYGSNLAQVKQLVEEAVNNMKLEWIDPEKPVTSLVSELGDSSVNFKLLVWTDAQKRGVVVSEVLSTVYDTLNQNNIEIPFPQQDVHIIEHSLT